MLNQAWRDAQDTFSTAVIDLEERVVAEDPNHQSPFARGFEKMSDDAGHRMNDLIEQTRTERKIQGIEQKDYLQDLEVEGYRPPDKREGNKEGEAGTGDNHTEPEKNEDGQSVDSAGKAMLHFPSMDE
jgi:hypothetical protein